MSKGVQPMLAGMAVASAFCLAGAGHAATASTAAADVARLEQLYSQSFVTGDVSIAKRLVAHDFIGFEPDGKTSDRAGILKDVRSEPRPISLTIPSLIVRVHGDTAIALGAEEDVMPDGQRVHRRWLDTWRRAPQGWLLISSGEMTTKP